MLKRLIQQFTDSLRRGRVALNSSRQWCSGSASAQRLCVHQWRG
jgi:hypothetical protein